MNMTFVYQWLQSSQFLLTALTTLALVTLPMLDLIARPIEVRTKNDQQTFQEGTYIYGQSPQPNQIGNEYIVFEVTAEKLIGVLYMPHSEFSCFEGEIKGDELDLIVDHPYEDTTNPYSIALESVSPIASGDETMKTPLTLKGYHPLEELSANDERMLDYCTRR